MIKQVRPILSLFTLVALHARDLTINYPTIPKPLPEVPAPTGAPIEKTKLHEIPNTEIQDSAEVWRQFIILSLICISRSTNRNLRFSFGISLMLGLPFRKRNKRFIDKVILEFHNFSCDNQMLIHNHSIVIPRFPLPEQAQYPRRICSMLNPAARKIMPTLQNYTINIFINRRQPRFYFVYQFLRQPLISIYSQKPFRFNIQIIQRPIKLRRLIPRPFTLNNRRAHFCSFSFATIS